ncbi:hypothetical protein SCHPADRAFT_1003285 [Schizopora paradoxa]|uniref:AAA+ ATPase domain-containing protein n=1 Tax=Schizopora paradoxa TaxID=27342 RepID=A0A0H2R4X4_9AGAM|nr:hypothetical protein SCHPADRAFT_1003285 [Schizopora paradoxa]
MSDLGKHIAVQKNIRIKFGDAKKLFASDELQVLLGDLDSITVVSPEKLDSLTRRWTLDSEILLFPGDTITFRVPIRKGHTFKALLPKSSKRKEPPLRDYLFKYEALAKKLGDLSYSNDSKVVTFAEDDFVLTFELVEGSIERIINMSPNKDLDPLLPEHVEGLINSSQSLWKNTQSLRNVLENIPVPEEAYQLLESTFAAIRDVHPLAKAIMTALAIPYKLLKNESVFKQKIREMAEAMRVACQCLMETRYHTKITFAKDVFKNILRLLRNAAVFIDIYCRKGRIQQVIGAQFPDKLDAFSKDLIKLKNDFQTAMILQISRDADSTAATTAEDYLRRRLSPVTQDPLGEGCLAETRLAVLNRVREWLDNADSEKRILWIVGAPGAGKTSIATSIAKGLRNRPYAKFFAKRDKPDLSDARRIWPSVACSLAEKHDGMKAALMLALRDEKNTDVRDLSVFHQFENFFKGPLEMDFKETGSRSSEVPVVIIDALDECYSRESSNWDSLLESLAGWPNNSKLIITSRYHYDLPERPSETYNFFDLVTGLNAPEENKNDIKVFFTIKFTQMKSTKAFRDFDLPKEWPRREEIEEMTTYASGLFIWADMAVKYIEARDGAGNDPVERLQNVLDDIRDEGRSRIKGENRVDTLYARIIFEAFPRSIEDERERAKRVLAAVLLAKEPLQKEDLIELMSPQISHNTVMSTLSKLKAIIPSSDYRLRVCHKSVSDFGLSRERSWAALLRLVPDDKDRHSYVIDVEKENKELALACLHSMRRKLPTSNITELPTPSQKHPNGFPYARHHWFEHVEEAGDTYRHIISNLRYLAGAMEVAYRSLERFVADLDLENDKGIALVGSLCSAIELIIQCVDTIDHEHEDFEALQKKLDEYTRNLGIVRGELQIAMVLRNHASASDESSTKLADSFLRRQIGPSDQTELDDECAPGTRSAILSEAENWLETPGAPNILWITGAPGAGKSAVAARLVHKVFPGIRLCAKFFAKRDFADRRDPSLLWRTLIYDFAKLHVGLRGSIMEALLGNSLSGSNDQSKHHRLLFKAIEDQQCLPVVVLIDALDEFSTEEHEQWRELLQAVSGCGDFPRSFKLVVTSRDLPGIREALSEVSQHILLPTGSNTTIEAKSDIEKVFRSKLSDFPRASYWLSEETLPHLMDHAAGSFIWAKMIIGLVQLDPTGCLENIVDGDSTGSTEDVDVLYAKVLKETLGQLREKEREICRAILSAIVLAREPLQRRFLEALPLNLNPEQVNQTTEMLFENLRSIITVDENLRVRIPHKSFTDFFLDKDRCSKAMEHLDLPVEERCTYLIREKDASAHLAIACLTWVKENLAFNAYRIPTSHSLNENPQQLEVECMDLALVYACRYWGEHLGQANRGDGFRARAQPLLRTFFHQKVLFWLEILSLEKAITSAEKSLMAAKEFLQGYDNDLVAFADDVLKFVTDFEDPITAAASHIYITALPFSPSNSRIFQVYAPRFPNLFSVTSGRREDWGDAPVTGNDGHYNTVLGVAFFRDGSRLASVSIDQTVRIWDSKTGEAFSTPFKHDSSVHCIAVSPDGKLIASGKSNGALSIWDSETGAHKLNLTGAHSDVIRSAVFSPDGSRIVTGSYDNTVKVWKTASGELCLGPLTGHTGHVYSVAFSPDGTLIASGSNDETRRIWDATTGKPHREPLVGHSNSVLCLTFTADGHYLASGSSDGTICLWDVIDGFTQTSFIISGSPVWSISFSPKSEILASGHGDGSLHFWNFRAGELHQSCDPIHGHTNYVNSIAFSPDGQILASGSNDKSVKFWAVPTVTTSKASHVRDGSAGKPQYMTPDLDQHGCRVLSDDCYIDRAGWLWDSHGEDAKVLLWVPKENRDGFWFPRNTAVIHQNVTKIDFRHFVHGENWAECMKPLESDG